MVVSVRRTFLHLALPRHLRHKDSVSDECYAEGSVNTWLHSRGGRSCGVFEHVSAGGSGLNGNTGTLPFEGRNARAFCHLRFVTLPFSGFFCLLRQRGFVFCRSPLAP